MIKLQDVTTAYDASIVLHEVSMRISEGESVAVIAPVNNSRETLRWLLNGTMTPSAGTLKIDGSIACADRINRQMLLPFSGADNIRLIAGLRRLDPDLFLAEVADLSTLSDKLGSKLDAFSAEESSMLSLAISATLRCDILSCDGIINPTIPETFAHRFDAFVTDRLFQKTHIRFFENATDVTLEYDRHYALAGPDLISCDSRQMAEDILSLANAKERNSYADR